MPTVTDSSNSKLTQNRLILPLSSATLSNLIAECGDRTPALIWSVCFCCLTAMRSIAIQVSVDGDSGAKADTAGATRFCGVNWADSRDNFVDGWIIPSGINHHAKTSDVSSQAREIMIQFKSLLGVNTVRLGINPATVLDEKWWPKYRMIISEATSLNLKVILACWESQSCRDGRIDNQEEFDSIWDRVLNDFVDSGDVYFEIFNEPYGYSDAEWRNRAGAWIERQGSKIKGGDRKRILVSGSGYNERLAEVAVDKRFDGCRLSLHVYAWFGGKHETLSGWTREIEERIGQSNATRTIVTEWGAPMKTRPRDYYTERAPDGDRHRAYVIAMANTIRESNMGSVYWPGLRDGDDFSLTERKEGTSILQITNESGNIQLQRSFNQTKVEDAQ